MCTNNGIELGDFWQIACIRYPYECFGKFFDLFDNQSHRTCVSKDGIEDELFGNGDCSIEQSLENQVAERSTMNPKIEPNENVLAIHSAVCK